MSRNPNGTRALVKRRADLPSVQFSAKWVQASTATNAMNRTPWANPTQLTAHGCPNPYLSGMATKRRSNQE